MTRALLLVSLTGLYFDVLTITARLFETIFWFCSVMLAQVEGTSKRFLNKDHLVPCHILNRKIVQI